MDEIIIPPASAATNGFVAGNRHREHQEHCDRGWSAGDVRGFMSSQFDNFNATMRRSDADTASADRADRASAAEAARQHAAILEATHRYGASGELAMEKTSAAINLAIEKTAAATMLDAAKNAAAVALASARDTATVLAAHAECCCEIKEKIGEEANRTRELMLRLDADGAARREAALAAQVSQLQLVAAVAARA